jgi:hypothetical protein
MRVLVLALALLPGAALADDAVAPSKPVVAAKPATAPGAKKQCANAQSQHVGTANGAVRARPLRDEPRANRYLPVLRMVDGCDKPVMIGEQDEGGR